MLTLSWVVVVVLVVVVTITKMMQHIASPRYCSL